jgi:hypothetical protein
MKAIVIIAVIGVIIWYFYGRSILINYDRWRASKSVRAVAQVVKEIVAPKRWPRPQDNGFHDLPEDAVKFMQETSCCPFCGFMLFEGPSGGMTVNAFCGDPECNSRFNIGMGGLPYGQFTGTCPEDFLEDRRKKIIEERRLASMIADNAPMI